eukprot:4989150-Amphidinium_carterae.1
MHRVLVYCSGENLVLAMPLLLDKNETGGDTTCEMHLLGAENALHPIAALPPSSATDVHPAIYFYMVETDTC